MAAVVAVHESEHPMSAGKVVAVILAVAVATLIIGRYIAMVAGGT